MYEAQFEGKIAVVTGGGSGIGAATVRELARRGAEVVYAVDVSAEGAEKVASGVEGARALQLDVSDSAAVADAFAGIVAEHGRLDVVVHAAGVDDPISKAWMLEAAEQGEPDPERGQPVAVGQFVDPRLHLHVRPVRHHDQSDR